MILKKTNIKKDRYYKKKILEEKILRFEKK